MTDMENREQNPQPNAAEQESQPTPVEQASYEQTAQEQSAPQSAPQTASEQFPAQEQPTAEPAPEPIPQPAWEKPVPELTLDPDPTATPFSMPEPPAAPDPSQAVNPPQQPQQPVQYATYNYNFNTAPDPGYQQPPQGYDPNYQPPNFTAQSYQPQPVQQPKYTTPPPGYQQKSRLAAALLAFTLGSLGVHNFYLGNNTRGTIQLIVCLAGGILTCGLGTVVTAIWALVEAVGLLSASGPKFDGNGVILRD